MPVSVKVTFVCKDLTGDYRGGICSVAEGTSIMEVINACLAERGVSFKGDIDYLTVCLRNGRRALYTDKVEQGDDIYVLRKVVGG